MKRPSIDDKNKNKKAGSHDVFCLVFIIRKTKCSGVSKQNVPICKTKRTSANPFSPPQPNKKAPRIIYFFGAFLLPNILAISQKITNFTTNKGEHYALL